MTTAVQIGPTTWDQHTGSLTPLAGSSVREERAADGSVKLYPQAKPDESSGVIVTTKLVASERVANQLNVLASALIDSRVSVALPGGVVLAGIRVQDVQIRQEKKRYRSESEWLVTATWTFGPKAADDGDPKELYVSTRVETCTEWGKWIPRPDLVCTAYVEAWGGSPGSAAFAQAVASDGAPLNVTGHWVRISIPTGDDLVRPTGYAVDWHGRIKTRDVGTSDGRITAVFAAVDLRDEFDTYLFQWYEKITGGVADPGEILPFNALPGGERSTDTDGPGNTYAHTRENIGSPWRASHIVDTLLAALEDQFPGGPEFTLGGQRTALDNFHPCDLDGRSLGEQISQLIGRGLGYRLVVTGDGVTVDVSSPLRATLTAAGWTIPANDRQTTLDLTDSEGLSGWSLGEDCSLVRDVVGVQFARPWHMTSLGASAADNLQLYKDWTAGEATTWATADETTKNTTLAHVYRRFRLASTWTGGGYGASTAHLPLDRTTGIDDIHGTDGETGDFETGGGFQAKALRFTKACPITQGNRDWSNPTSEQVDPREPLVPAFVCRVRNPGVGVEKWKMLDMEVTVDSEAPVVSLGRDALDAAILKASLDAGDHLVVTLGYRYPLPWRVSWRRAGLDRVDELQGAWDEAQAAADADPGDLDLAAAAAAAEADFNTADAQGGQTTSRPRAVLYQRPDIEYRYMDDQTVVGLLNGDAVVANAGVIDVKPDSPDQLLALARLTHEKPIRDITWTKAGLEIDADFDPGAMITEATLPYGGDDGTEVTIDGIITARARTLDRTHPATSWTCSRQMADVVISPKQGAGAPPGAAALLAALAYKS